MLNIDLICSAIYMYFSPTRRDMVASLALLADMTAQAKAIEILISHAHDVSNKIVILYFADSK